MFDLAPAAAIPIPATPPLPPADPVEAAVAAERRRVARDIHDGVGQALGAVVIHLQLARRAIAGDPARADALVAAALAAARDGLEDARRAVWDVRPEPLDGDLPAALARLADRCSTARVRVTFAAAGPSRPVPAAAAVELYRIAQEAVANALRHARARAVGVRLRFAPTAVRLAVRDDGQGEAGRPAEGRGRAGMRERAARVGAALALRTAPRRGTAVVVTLPLADGDLGSG